LLQHEQLVQLHLFMSHAWQVQPLQLQIEQVQGVHWQLPPQQVQVQVD
jgi:hypothetical protein